MTATTGKVLTVVSLAGSVGNTSAIDWSEDNRIAFTSQEGIHVLVPQCKAGNTTGRLTFNRQFVSCTTVVNQFDVGIDRDTLHDKLNNNREALYGFMLERTLSPAVESRQSFKGFRRAKWSCREATSDNKCLLATLTMDHRLELHGFSGNEWKRIADLSDTFYNYVKNRNYSDCVMPTAADVKIDELLLHQFVTRTYTLSATELVWTAMFERERRHTKQADSQSKLESGNNNKFSILISAMKSGQIVLWKVLTTPNDSSAVEVLSIFNAEIGRISSITWQQVNTNSGLLAVGSLEGQIRMFYLSIRWEEKNGNVTHDITSSLWIWNYADKLAVNQIRLLRPKGSVCHLLAGRGSYLMACELEVKERDFVLKNQSFSVGPNTLPITGICQMHDAFLITSADGCLLNVQLETSKAGLKINNNVLRFESNDPCDKSLMGIASSPTQVFVSVIGKRGDYFDHLSIKEPLDLTVFTTTSVSESVSSMLRYKGKLNDIQDVLEHVRLCLLSEDNLPNEINQLISWDVDKLEKLSDYEMMLIRWWLKWIINNQASVEDRMKYKDRIRIIEEKLMKRHLLKRLRAPVDFSQVGCRSIITCCKWLETTDLKSSEQNLVKKAMAKRIINAFIKEHGLEEKCAICQENFSIDNISSATCPNGHSFARCSISLQICDQPYYKMCVKCGVMAQKKDEKSRCIFCDGEIE